MKIDRFNYLKMLMLVLCLPALSTAVRAQQSNFYFYDDNGRSKAIISPTGEIAVYEYDPSGNFTAVRRLNPNSLEILGFTPKSGSPGTRVKFYGTGFNGVSSVRFNGTPAAVISSTNNIITAEVPPNATSGVVSINTPLGTAVTSTPFTVSGCIPKPPKLLVNGNAEADPTATGDGTIDHDVSNWDNETGAFTITRYGIGSGFPTTSDQGPANRGLFFFSGGNSASSSAVQVISLGNCSAQIDSGNQGFDLSGFLGGFSNQNDQAKITVTFKNSDNMATGTASIGPVTASDRKNITGLFSRTNSGIIPVGTRNVEVLLQMTRFTGTSNDGYADNITFTLTQGISRNYSPDSTRTFFFAGNGSRNFGIAASSD